MRSTSYPPPSRPVAMGINGMVASAHYLASAAGLHVLQEGGNAFDAAVATGSTLGVVEPHMSGVGGIGVALAYVAAEGQVRALDFSGRAPQAAQWSRFNEKTKEKWTEAEHGRVDYGAGVLSPLVPGNPAGWLALHERYGSLDLERLFRPAIDYADNGFPVTSLTSFVIGESASRLREFPASASILLGTGDRPPAAGSVLKMPALAGSLRLIAEGGHEAFYRGGLAERIVKGSQEAGGILSDEDLAAYEAEWQDPVSVTYGDFRVLTSPPSSCGFQILQTLRLLEGYDGLRFQDPETVHLQIEAAKLSGIDRIRHGNDPDYVSVPVNRLLSDEHVAALRRRLRVGRAGESPGNRYVPGVLEVGQRSAWESDSGMTTSFAVADRDGNVVNVTQTLGAFFGSAVVAGDTGIFLNNGCYWFDGDEDGPNPIGPRKRVAFVLAPTQTLRDGSFHLSLGTTGGYGIFQTTPQMLLNMLEFGMDVQQAIDAPRFSTAEGVRVMVEEGFPKNVRRALSAWGHEFSLMNGYPMGLGSAHGIVVDSERGVFQGGADPRRDGIALGW